MSKPRVVIVTGASRGIGAATAKLLARRGYTVLVNFANDSYAADSIVAEIADGGGMARSHRADISKESDAVTMFERAAELGTLYGLVNNAGVTGGFSRVEGVAVKAIEDVLAINVLGTILCCREAVKRMSTKHGGRGGAIVNIGSLVARTGGANDWVHYAASKGAVHSFTLGLAREVADEGIRVNCVAPGLIETELHARNGRPDRAQQLSPAIPMHRFGTAEEVANGIAWLLSEEASYVTGTILEIGGGR